MNQLDNFKAINQTFEQYLNLYEALWRYALIDAPTIMINAMVAVSQPPLDDTESP